MRSIKNLGLFVAGTAFSLSGMGASAQDPAQGTAASSAAIVSSAAAPVQTTSDESQLPLSTLPIIQIIGVAPLPGTGVDADEVPTTVQTLSSPDLQLEGSPSVTNSLADQVGGISMNGTLDDAFQPNILYRGFEASPVLGTPQGLAVYQNGVRVNEAFGDTVNWDLFPDFAVDRVDVLGSDPVYGLNALGGAVVINMKNGFTYNGFESELAGGSFGQRSASFEYGGHSGIFGTYLAAKGFQDDGWRDFSQDYVRQLYADFGARGDRTSLDLSFSGADNQLYGQGTAPVQELAVNRSLVFTGPQEDANQLAFVTLNGSYRPTDALSIQSNVYRREFLQKINNGNTTDYTACTSGNGFLCQSDGTTVLMGPDGNPVPDISNGGTNPIGENDLESIHTITWGGTGQMSYAGQVLGHDNALAFGGSADSSNTDFESATEVGVITPSLQVLPGYFITTPEGTSFNATPVSLGAVNNDYGFFATDTLNATPELALTASGRYNSAGVDLTDHNGTDLSGDNRYNRFNPAVGGTYKVTSELTAYAGYSEGARAPTPSEIECSNPAQPCLLPSSLSSDPPTLKQVVSHTYETGLRGGFALPRLVPGRFTWSTGFFRTNLTDDIYGVATTISTGFFENIGSTRRQGIEVHLDYKDADWAFHASYSLIDATFESALTLPAPNNPYADMNGNIEVTPGDHLPGIPMNQFKVGADYHVTMRWTVGTTLIVMGPEYYYGDESNQNPQLPGYQVLNLHSSYDINKHVEIFVGIQNVLDSHYNTFGQFGDPTGIGTPGVPAGAVPNRPGVDSRFVSPAAPISATGGIRVKF